MCECVCVNVCMWGGAGGRGGGECYHLKSDEWKDDIEGMT